MDAMTALRSNINTAFAGLPVQNRFTIGQTVQFVYSDKVRVGVVHTLRPGGVTLAVANGGFRSFNLSGIRGFIILDA